MKIKLNLMTAIAVFFAIMCAIRTYEFTNVRAELTATLTAMAAATDLAGNNNSRIMVTRREERSGKTTHIRVYSQDRFTEFSVSYYGKVVVSEGTIGNIEKSRIETWGSVEKWY